MIKKLRDIRNDIEQAKAFRIKNLAATCPDCDGPKCQHGVNGDTLIAHLNNALIKLEKLLWRA